VLFVLSDTGFGEGGTAFLRGGPRVVAAALSEAGEMTHAELLRLVPILVRHCVVVVLGMWLTYLEVCCW
jgi:hypothetical protein